jgi:ABC-type antimicrobial peptide transport system permease subunit
VRDAGARAAHAELKAAYRRSTMTVVTPTAPQPRRQIRLPLSKAAEIAYKSIRLRLGRSLLVTSGIVLAIAFLVSILTSDAIARGMRRWVRAAPASQSAAARTLEAKLRLAGVPSSDAEAADARLQRRWLTGLALLVALVGILNAMLMSVTERYREIGTMKCLGALDGFIVKLFLLESLFQGLAGTLAGVVLGIFLSVIAASVRFGSDAFRELRTTEVAGAATFSFAVGIALTIIGSVYPAWRAARMQPVEAMRVET